MRLNKRAEAGFQDTLLLIGKLVLAAIIIFSLFFIGYALYNMIVGQDKDAITSQSMYSSLVQRIAKVSQDPTQINYYPATAMLNAKGYSVVGFDSGTIEDTKISIVTSELATSTNWGNPSNINLISNDLKDVAHVWEKPSACGDNACLCLFDGYEHDYAQTLTEADLVMPCTMMGEDIQFRSLWRSDDLRGYLIGSGSFFRFPVHNIYSPDIHGYEDILKLDPAGLYSYGPGIILPGETVFMAYEVYIDRWAFSKPAIIFMTTDNDVTQARMQALSKKIADYATKCYKLDADKVYSSECLCVSTLKPKDNYCCPQAKDGDVVQAKKCVCKPVGELSNCLSYTAEPDCSGDICKSTNSDSKCVWNSAKNCCYLQYNSKNGVSARVIGEWCV